MSEVVIFAPQLTLTVTIEDRRDGPDVHIHAGGQGMWQAQHVRLAVADTPANQDEGSDAALLLGGFATITSIASVTEATTAALSTA